VSETGICCHDDRRRPHLRATDRLNGIDYVEVEEVEGRTELHVYLLRSLPADEAGRLFSVANVVIEGGTSVTDLAIDGDVEFRHAPDPVRDDIAVLRLNHPGDHSRYTLRLVETDDAPIPDIDPRYRLVTFTFVAGTRSDVDCLSLPPGEPLPVATPELSYLAKDYASFRQQLLDRLATTMPGWRERHAADLYLSILEVLAYEADRLSYAQDAVATEAYLDTARLRTSVRRHVRLVDYPMHEGCNSRTWVCLDVEDDPRLRAEDIAFLTRPEGVAADRVVLREDDLTLVSRSSYEVFEPLLASRPTTVVPGDVVRPEEFARRVVQDPGEAFDQLRARFSEEERRTLEQEEPDVPSLLDLLTQRLTDLLNDTGWALRSEDAIGRVLNEYGTLTALTGGRLATHNRSEMEDMFPEELAGPGQLRLYQAHNTIPLYTWRQADCVLVAGATSATLRDKWEEDRHRRALRHLRPGDVLVFEEVRGPHSGESADADPAHRHAVRLTTVTPTEDPIGHVPVVEVGWAPADALRFPLVLSTRGPAPECALLENVTVVRGNVMLVDHGETVPGPARLRHKGHTIVAGPFDPPDDVVPAGTVELCCTAAGTVAERPPDNPVYEPVLARSTVVFAEPLPFDTPATAALQQNPRRAIAAVAVFSPVDRPTAGQEIVQRLPDETMKRARALRYERWRPRRDLLSSGSSDRHVVVEVDDDRGAHLRFGDGQLGTRPLPGTRMLVWYRTGGGVAGNVGDGAIRHVVLLGEISGGWITGVRNPLPASGGTDPEPVEEVRLRAPHAFRTRLERAVTVEDYSAIVVRDFPGRVQRATAKVTVPADRALVTVFVDPAGTAEDVPALRDEIRRHLERYRQIGHLVEVTAARYVPLSVAVTAAVLPGHQPGAVRGALLDRLSNRTLPNGTRGFFHPDELTLGESIAISQVIAAMAGVPGIAWARVTRLARRGVPPDLPEHDVLIVQPDEIARLDNNPDLPELGDLEIRLEVAL
jgi:hypothetical protein